LAGVLSQTPLGELTALLQNPLAGFKGPTSRGRGGEGMGGEGKEWDGTGGEGREVRGCERRRGEVWERRVPKVTPYKNPRSATR